MMQNSSMSTLEVVPRAGELLAVLILFFLFPVATDGRDALPEVGRMLRKEVIVHATLNEAWAVWTTDQGAQTFFAPRTNIDPTIGGHYEIYFMPDQPYGKRGADDCKVHSIVPNRSLAFTWNTPPSIPELRDAKVHTIVFLRFEPVDSSRTRVQLTQLGWGDTQEWTRAFEYFDSAWDTVLGRLKIRFDKGPIDWTQPPRPTESLNLK